MKTLSEDSIRYDGAEVKLSGSRNVGELKLGSEGQLNQNINLWSNVAQRIVDRG